MAATVVARAPMSAGLRLYPTVPSLRRSAIIRDAACLFLIGFFLWCGVGTYAVVNQLTALGTAVSDTGTSIQNGLGSAASAVGALPIVGSSLANALNGAGSSTGSNLVSLGQQSIDQAHHLAVLLGLLVALLPILVLLLATLPRRIRAVRSLTAAGTVLSNTRGPSSRQILASRAAFGLPYGVLLAYTPDPFGDLAAGRYDALIAAAMEDSGLRAPVPV